MTKDEAIAKVGQAVLKKHGVPEDKWREYPKHKEFAEDLVAALEALGLFKSSP